MHAIATNKYMPKCPCLVFQRSYTDKCDRMTKDEYYECFVTVCLFPKMLDILSEDQMCHKLAKPSLSCYHPPARGTFQLPLIMTDMKLTGSLEMGVYIHLASVEVYISISYHLLL